MSALPIGLTFDDGPDEVWTPAVLDALRAERVRATFFVIAPRAVAHPDLVGRMADEGHAVELHCDQHIRHTQLAADELAQDTADALERLRALGVRPALWRTPWGVSTRTTADVARRHALRLVHWTADTEDWAGHAPGAMVARVARTLRPGGTVLAHDGLGPGALRSGCANTVEAIPGLVALARRLGAGCGPLAPDGTVAA